MQIGAEREARVARRVGGGGHAAAQKQAARRPAIGRRRRARRHAEVRLRLHADDARAQPQRGERVQAEVAANVQRQTVVGQEAQRARQQHRRDQVTYVRVRVPRCRAGRHLRLAVPEQARPVGQGHKHGQLRKREARGQVVARRAARRRQLRRNQRLGRLLVGEARAVV